MSVIQGMLSWISIARPSVLAVPCDPLGRAVLGVFVRTLPTLT